MSWLSTMILLMAYKNPPYNWVVFHTLYTADNQHFSHCSSGDHVQPPTSWDALLGPFSVENLPILSLACSLSSLVCEKYGNLYLEK